MAYAFGDTLAMSLVAVGAVLIGLLIWLLMRKYNREYRREAEPSKIATPGTMSPETTATLVSPFRGPDKNFSAHGMDSPRPRSEKSQKPKDDAAVSSDESPSSAEKQKGKRAEEKPKDKPTKEKSKDRPADESADKPVADREGVDVKARGRRSKRPVGSPASAGSLEPSKAQSPKSEHRKKKSKKSGQLSPTNVDSKQVFQAAKAIQTTWDTAGA